MDYKRKMQLLILRGKMQFPLDVKYIVEAEPKLGVIFPAYFKAKAIRENGGPDIYLCVCETDNQAAELEGCNWKINKAMLTPDIIPRKHGYKRIFKIV